MAKNLLIHLAGRVLNTPLMITETKLSAILAVLLQGIPTEMLPGELDAIADFSV